MHFSGGLGPEAVWSLYTFPRWLRDKGSSWQRRRLGFGPWVGEIPWRRAWQPTAVFLPGESHGQRSLAATVHGVACQGCHNEGLPGERLVQQKYIFSQFWSLEVSGPGAGGVLSSQASPRGV